MKLDWQVHKKPNHVSSSAEGIPSFIHLTTVPEYDESGINAAVILSIDKAVSLLCKNIDDNSRYFIFEWDVVHSILSIAVTNDKKESDAPEVVQCCFSGLAENITAANEKSEITENVKDIARDYLTTCPGFFNYSLVAIFHTDGRSQSVLL